MVNEKMIKKLKRDAIKLRRKIDRVKNKKRKEKLLKEYTKLIYDILELPINATYLYHSYSPTTQIVQNISLEERREQAKEPIYLRRM